MLGHGWPRLAVATLAALALSPAAAHAGPAKTTTATLTTFGELRIGEPARSGAPTVGPAILRWPELDPGAAATEVPVTVLANGGLSPAAATIDGPDPHDFRVTRDGCAGQRLATGGRCQVWVRFTPTAPGARQAALHVAGQAVALQGFAHGGRTRLVLDS